MANYVRYAVYYTPPMHSALANFGAAWLGRSLDGAALPPELSTRIEHDMRRDITASPRRYGFHGTIKAPFHLKAAAGLMDLIDGAAAIAATQAPAACGPLALTSIGPFLALCPTGETGDLAHLAARTVRELDHLRAPLTEAERSRRRPDRLTVRQRRHLDSYGYPYIFDEFRFHLTLTGPLDADLHDRVRAELGPLTQSLCGEPFAVDALSVLGDPGDGAPFELVERFSLAGPVSGADEPPSAGVQAVTGA